MKTLKTVLLLAAVLLCGQVLAQTTLYVDDTGPSCPTPADPNTVFGSGTQGDPYCFIGHAVLSAAGGETIQVMPGTYAECFDTGATAVAIQADDSDPLLGPANFTIDPNFACDTPVILGNLSSIDGFTVQGGNASGMLTFGGVSITNNVITGNNSPDFGGGLYVVGYAGYYGYGDVNITIEDNTISGNIAKADGGGAYLWNSATGTSSADLLFRNNRVLNNVIAGPPVNPSIEAVHGGGVSAWTATGLSAAASIVITQNTISDNDADFGTAYNAYGGGIFAQTYGYGTETITIQDNPVITGNSSNGDGAGISAWMFGDPSVASDHQMIVSGNTVSGNTAAGGGGGIDLFVFADTLTAGIDLNMTVSDNVVTGNAAHGVLGGGGISATLTPINNSSTGAFSVEKNTIRGNTSTFSGGGMVVVMYPFQNAGSSIGDIKVQNNLIVENSTSGFGGGVDTFISSTVDATGTISLDFNTISDNTAAFGAGGVSITSGTSTFDDEFGAHIFRVENSVISSNSGYGIGLNADDAEGVLNLDDIEYNIVFGNTPGEYDSAISTLANIGSSTNVSDDPLLDAFWFPQVCSPAIDGADPAEAFSNEPQPNGGRANAGRYGDTSKAVTILADTNGDNAVDGLDILALAVAFASSSGEPRYDLSADLDLEDGVGGSDLSLVGAHFGVVCP